MEEYVCYKEVSMTSTRKHPKYEYITKRWGGMKIRDTFAKRIDEWLKAFPEEEHAFLLELLAEFYYYSEERIKKNVVELNCRFLKNFEGDINEVVYTKIIKEQGIAFSDVLFTTFWLQNSISNAENNIIGLLEEEQVPKTIVVVDDYSGTGKTLIKTINTMLQINEAVKDVKFYFLTLHMTNRSVIQINEYARNVGLDITLVSLDYTDETFKKNYIYNDIDAESKKRNYSEICKSKKVKEDYILGYEDVSSLVAFHYNTPNNTLGLFWQDLAEFAALFPRKRKRRTELSRMQQEARNRRNREKPVVIYGIADGKMTVMLTYCVGQTKGISVEKFKDTFGLTTSQANDFLKEMIKQDYIVNDKGYFSPTAKLKSHMFTSRIKKGQEQFKSIPEEKTEFKIHDEYIPRNF